MLGWTIATLLAAGTVSPVDAQVIATGAPAPAAIPDTPSPFSKTDLQIARPTPPPMPVPQSGVRGGEAHPEDIVVLARDPQVGF